jgi:hypothetical protein
MVMQVSTMVVEVSILQLGDYSGMWMAVWPHMTAHHDQIVVV